MTKREASAEVALGVEALMGLAGENQWLFFDRDGKARELEDVQRMVNAFNKLATELAIRGKSAIKGDDT